MRFINTSDLTGPEWRFLEPVSTNPDLSWDFYYGRPSNALERRIRRPAIARWRAALGAALAARRQPGDRMLVSHLPSMSAATNTMRRRLCPEVPHVAFAFNFTDRPQGRRLTAMKAALRDIDEFVVFSRFEQATYAGLLDLPQDRFRFLPWAMDPPVPGPDNPVAGTGPYFCAVGGEGRDYPLLARAMRDLPDQRMVVIARPFNVQGVDFPPNVTVFTNLPQPVTWRIAADSRGLVIPLKTDRTACGHVTLVGAQLLGLPLVITRSEGVADYVSDDTAGLVGAGDAAALTAAVADLAARPDAARARADQARALAQVKNSPASLVTYFEELAARFGGTP